MEHHQGFDLVENAVVRDFVYGSEGDGGRMLSPISRGTLESERRSFISPSRLGMYGTMDRIPDAQASRTSLHSGPTSGQGGASEGLPSTESSVSVDDPGVHIRPAVDQTSTVVSEYIGFIDACKNLEIYLSEFIHQVQKLGSALRLVKASRLLHNDVTTVRTYFEQNNQLNFLLGKLKITKSQRQARRRKRRGTETAGPRSSLTGTYTEDLNGALTKLADSVHSFTVAIVDFEDYTDDEGNIALEKFEIELRVLSGGLEFFGVEGETDYLHRFVTARASALKSYLEDLLAALQRFEKTGIPCISFAQKRSTRMTLNAATVATFFAGVAATTLQYTVALTSNKRELAINTLWFSSLVLSTGSAITGMLAMTWRLAVFSSPKRSLPWFIRFWIWSGYLALLVASVIAFLAGLVIYVFDSQPNKIAFWIVTALTAFCMVGLASVTFVFVKERLNFSAMRVQMRKEFSPIQRFYGSSGANWKYWLRYYLVDQLRRKRLTLFTQGGSGSAHLKGKTSFFEQTRAFFSGILPWSKGLQRHPTQDSEVMANDGVGHTRPSTWKRGSRQPVSSRRNLPDRTQSDPLQHTQNSGDPDFIMWYNKQVKQLGLSLYAPMEQRGVDLQFSPDGRWLVVCYKYECCVYDVQKSFGHHQILRHLRKKAKQVEWSPDSRRLLTRTGNGVKIWAIDEHDNFIHDIAAGLSDIDVTDIQWLNNIEFLAIASELTFFRVDISGEEATRKEYNIEWDNELLEVYYLYTMPESELVMIVGARKVEGLPEDKTIDCIIIYRMDEEPEGEAKSQTSRSTQSTAPPYALGSIARRIPLLTDVQSLSFGFPLEGQETLRHMLVGYLNKPPEVWTIDMKTLQANLLHQLETEADTKHDDEAEWGDVFLIGPTKSIVACAENGVMHFWDLEKVCYFHKLEIANKEEIGDDLPAIAWSPHSPMPLLASAGRNLPLNIWAPMKEEKRGSRDSRGTPMRNRSSGPQLQIAATPGGVEAPPQQSPLALPRAMVAPPDVSHREPSQVYPPSPRIAENIMYSHSPESSIKGDEGEDGDEIKAETPIIFDVVKDA